MIDNINNLFNNLNNLFKLDFIKQSDNPFKSLIYIICLFIIGWSSLNTITSIFKLVKIISLIIITIFLISNYVPKNDKNFAVFLSLIPILPANRVYTKTLDKDTIFIRLIPIIGNLQDLYFILFKNKLKPADGWNK